MNMLPIVILTLICMSIFFAFAVDSYQESKPGNEKRKSRVLPTDFVLHLNGFFHLVFIHVFI